MPRTREVHQPLWRCTESFMIPGANGVPEVFAEGDEILDSDPILKTHRHMFEPAAARVLRRSPVEQTTAAPGEVRPAVTTTKEIPNG